MGFVRITAIIFLVLLVVYGLYCFASNKLKIFPDSFTIEFWMPLILWMLVVVLFFSTLISIDSKHRVNDNLLKLDKQIKEIEIFYETIKDKPGYITICQDAIDDYNSYLNTIISQHKILKLDTLERFKGYYNYYLDIDTLELNKIPVNID